MPELDASSPYDPMQHSLLESMKRCMSAAYTNNLSSQPEFIKLLECGRKMTLPPKEMIYQENTQSKFIYYVSHGLVKETIYLPNGKQKIINVNQTGSLFGLESLFDKQHSFHAYSISSCDIIAIPIANALKLRHQCPDSYCAILENVLCYQQCNEKWNAEFSTGSVKARVARILCYLIILNDMQDTIPIISGEDIAALASATIESISRVLASFKRGGILSPVMMNEELQYRYDLDTLITYTKDDKSIPDNNSERKEQRRFRRSCINSKADIYVDEQYIDTGIIRNYSQQGMFLAFRHALNIPANDCLTIRIRNTSNKRLGKILSGKIIRKTTTGLGLKISDVTTQ